MAVCLARGRPRQDVDCGGGYGWYGGGAYTANHVEGALVIDIFDAEQRKLVFHSHGQTDLYGNQRAASAEKNADGAAEAILKEFPSEQK